MIDLQCCVSFRCTAKWYSYTQIYIHSFADSFPLGYYKTLIYFLVLNIINIIPSLCKSLLIIDSEKPLCSSRSDRTEHGTTDWLQIGKGVRQGCILSSCLFNLHAEHIMWNAGIASIYVNPKLLIYPFPALSPLVNVSLLYMFVVSLCFLYKFICIILNGLSIFLWIK